MVKRRHAVASFALICVFGVWFAGAQDVAHENAAQGGLDLVTIGNGHLPDGTKTAFRVYAAPDGSEGKVVYTKLNSVPAAQQLIEEWLKGKLTVTSRQKDQTIGSQVISDRILALGDLPKSDKKEFVIIRRDEVNCYLIESTSLQFAIKIEALIGHK
jgi:hypothetical protein